MSVETIARRYATALADIVTNSGDTGTVKGELEIWGEMLNSNGELHTALANPAIAHAKKEGVLEGLLQRSRPTQTTANFLRILLRNNRLTELDHIIDKFEAVMEERSGAVQAHVASAHQLEEQQRSELKTNLEKLTGKRVTLNFEIRPELIGGVVTRVGSTVYDSSVRTQLENLREQLMQK